MSKKTRNKLCQGSTTVQTAIVCPVFLFLVFSVLEFSYVSYSKLNIEYALAESGRYMVTGQGIDTTHIPPDPNARLNLIENIFCKNLLINGISCADVPAHFAVSCVNPSICTSPGPVSCPAGCTQPGGGPSQTVTVTVTFTTNWLSGIFNRLMPRPTLSAKTTWKNEPFL